MSAEAVAGDWVPDMTSFGARLALLRQRMGWNVKQAATECGLPAETWRHWETGGSPRNREDVAARIAARTGCSYAWLAAGPRALEPRTSDPVVRPAPSADKWSFYTNAGHGPVLSPAVTALGHAA